MRIDRLSVLQRDLVLRDVVDLYYLEQAGYRIEDYLDDALRKDAGATPATIAWLLSTMRVPERLPGDVSRDALVAYLRALEARLRQRGYPQVD